MKASKFILFLLLAVCAFSDIFSQPLAMDTIRNQEILLGEVTREHLEDSIWFIENYNHEKILEETIRKISESPKNIDIDVYFGSWCEDSQKWLPVFVNILDHTDLKGSVRFVGLPRAKEEREKMAPGIGIEKVPTFIFKLGGEEIGRIIENPETKLSSDILSILQQK